MTGELYDARTGRLIIARMVRADTLVMQTAGLLARTHFGDDEGMWFDRASAVHTLGMRVSIDVVFVAGKGAVLDVAPNVKPWRFWVGCAGAKSVLELAAGNAQRRGITTATVLDARWHSHT